MKGAKGIVFAEGGEELLGEIRGLWEELNRYQGERSIHFAEEFAGFRFAFRRERLREKAGRGALRVEIARERGRPEPIAYCVSSAGRDGSGEIDSLFVGERHRGRGIGGTLLRRALRWLDASGAGPATVVVAEGNARAREFYERRGFLPFSATLSRKGGAGKR